MSTALQEQASVRQACPLPMTQIHPNPAQPRKFFDEQALAELSSSIRRYGLLQPITVRMTNGTYEIIMGERRFRACQMLGCSHIDAFILQSDAGQSALMALVENIQRENLHFFEEAEAYARIVEGGMPQELLARHVGKSASCVANKLRLLKLSDALRLYITENGLTERHARALLRLPEGPARSRVARQAAEQRLSVSKTEALVERALACLHSPIAARRVIGRIRDHRPYVNAIRQMVSNLQQSGVDAQYQVVEYDTAVSVCVTLPKMSAGSGR